MFGKKKPRREPVGQVDARRRPGYPATEHLVAAGVLDARPFTVIDIGCSGGIAPQWRVFGPSLRAAGLDAMLGEIERLRQAETFPQVRYAARLAGLPADHPLVRARGERDPWGRNPWDRLSVKPAMDALAARQLDDAAKVQANLWDHTRLAAADSLVGVSEFAAELGFTDVDFIKIDIDGHDLFALASSEAVIHSGEVLGFLLEVNYFGTDDDSDHTFHNMDRFMRRQGFDLFDLTVRRYSRTALPAPFQGSAPGPTDWGVPLQGDALYARDLAHPAARGRGSEMPVEKLLKLMAIYELFGLPDCAAEVVDVFRDRIAPVVDPERLLDLLTPLVDGEPMGWADYRRLFATELDRFFRR